MLSTFGGYANAMHVELKHTITVPHNAWFMRLYRRVWSFTDEPSNPTFCSLFWGYLLMPLGLLLWVVLVAVKSNTCPRIELR